MNNNILIIESGSSKADWALIRENTVSRSQTLGMNPSHQSDFSFALAESGICEMLKVAEEIVFYGAGVSSTIGAETVKKNLQVYTQSPVHVYTDLMAAARACLGNKKGIVGILGTGANSCYFDGKEAHSPLPSMGYIFSDEGGGCYIGREIVKAYFYSDMPLEVEGLFFKKYKIEREDVIKSMYREYKGPAYLASFVPFLNDVEGEWKNMLLTNCFDAFIKTWIQRIEGHTTLPIHMIGSIACHFQRELTTQFNAYGLEVTSFMQRPMDGLIDYHKHILA